MTVVEEFPVHQRTPATEYTLDETLVRGLLTDQHPEFTRLPIRACDTGWDNAIFRLGDAYAVRLPSRQIAAPLVLHEQACLPRLAPRLPLPVPTPVRCGAPGRGYPWPWSVVPWLPGTTADRAAPHPEEATTFAAFLAALHSPAPPDAPANSMRGVPLQQRASMVTARLQRLRARTSAITPEVEAAWADALAAPVATDRRWLHGDLHARNVLVQHGRLSGIIDWGDVTAGDVATDLASIWMLFGEAAARRLALAYYNRQCQGMDAARWRRARGWAVLFGVTLLETGLMDHPRHAAMGRAILQRLTVDMRQTP